MTRKQTAMYGIALALILFAAFIIEAFPRTAIGMILGAGLSILIAERW